MEYSIAFIFPGLFVFVFVFCVGFLLCVWVCCWFVVGIVLVGFFCVGCRKVV